MQKQAVKNEWEGLVKNDVWDEQIFEWDQIRLEARRTGKTVHVGYLTVKCFEKHSESETLKKAKGRICFRGDYVVDENQKNGLW